MREVKLDLKNSKKKKKNVTHYEQKSESRKSPHKKDNKSHKARGL